MSPLARAQTRAAPYKDAWANSLETACLGSGILLSVVGLVFSMAKRPDELFSVASFPSLGTAYLFEFVGVAAPFVTFLLGAGLIVREVAMVRVCVRLCESTDLSRMPFVVGLP